MREGGRILSMESFYGVYEPSLSLGLLGSFDLTCRGIVEFSRDELFLYDLYD